MNSSLVNPFVPDTAAPPRRRAWAGLLARGVLVAGLAVSAAGAGAQTSVTLYGGARGGGDFEDASGNGNTFKLKSGAAASVSVDWLLDDGRVGQVFYSFQRSALPGEMYTVFMHYKRDEWERYCATVTDWDVNEYLDVLP